MSAPSVIVQSFALVRIVVLHALETIIAKQLQMAVQSAVVATFALVFHSAAVLALTQMVVKELQTGAHFVTVEPALIPHLHPSVAAHALATTAAKAH
jgi:hypothetical protein